MRAYRVGATIADERGFGESVKIYGVYLFLEQGESSVSLTTKSLA